MLDFPWKIDLEKLERTTKGIKLLIRAPLACDVTHLARGGDLLPNIQDREQRVSFAYAQSLVLTSIGL